MHAAAWSRRKLLGLGAAGLGGVLVSDLAWGQHVVKNIRELAPGEFSWQPELAPAGPVSVVVSLPDQRVHVYRNGIRIAVSTCSTGKAGHDTPTGVFTILARTGLSSM